MEYRYTTDDSGQFLVVTTAEAAEHHAGIETALYGAKTWRQFREMLPASELVDNDSFDEMFEEHEDDEPFDMNLVYGVGDGDYPPRLLYDAEYILPEEILEEFTVSTRLHGDFAEIPLDELPRVRAALESEGHTLVEL